MIFFPFVETCLIPSLNSLPRVIRPYCDIFFCCSTHSYMENLTPFIDLVGWSTSSLRRRDELPKVVLYLDTEALCAYSVYSYHSIFQLKGKLGDDKYPHIIVVETARVASPQEVASEDKVNGYKNVDMEGLLVLYLNQQV